MYSIRVAASPGFTLPKIRAARSATDTTWITAVTSFPSGITRTLAPVYKEQRINEANGQVARFEDTYAEYVKYPLITKKRMFYETMEEVLPDLKVIITGGNGTQTLLPLEPFSEAVSGSAAQTGGGN